MVASVPGSGFCRRWSGVERSRSMMGERYSCVSLDEFLYFDIDLSHSNNNQIPYTQEEEDDFEFDLCISNLGSPADDLFCKGRLLPLQIYPNPQLISCLPPESPSPFAKCPAASHKSQLPSLLKSVTKWKISLLGLRKTTKSADLQSPSCCCPATHGQRKKRLLTVKFKVMEVSLFSRDGSRRSSDSEADEPCKKPNKESSKAKHILHKYAKMIKYIKVSHRHFHRESASSKRTHLKMVYRQNPKSHLPSKMPSTDSTLLELQSAIQGAIAYCKQSNSLDGR